MPIRKMVVATRIVRIFKVLTIAIELTAEVLTAIEEKRTGIQEAVMLGIEKMVGIEKTVQIAEIIEIRTGLTTIEEETKIYVVI